MDRSGMAVATLASRPGARAAVPALRDPPLLTMADMGMNHGSGGMDHGGGDMAGMDDSDMGHDTRTQSATAEERKRVVKGKKEAVRVDLGGRRIIYKHTTNNIQR